MVKALADLFRYNISNKNSVVPLESELRNLDNYLNIQQFRFNNKFKIIKDIQQEAINCWLPKLIVQPLVENAIKHGLEPKVGSGSIEVAARATATGIEIRVDDSGLGLPPDDADDPAARPVGTSYGVQHVRDRLQAVYGPAARLVLQRRQPNGVSAVVFIPT
jgi:LytS/YehU family sensor histidine kinase